MDKSAFKILVADDDEIVRDVVVKFLAGDGYSLHAASDGLEAIKICRREDIKLILTDLRMPGADGMEVLRMAIQHDPKICVVMMTAYGTLDTALEAMKEGAYDYIVKPFVMQQLLLVVRNAYRMAGLIEQNESLSRDLRETYHKLEAVNPAGSESRSLDNASSDPEQYILKLKELNVIDEGEVRLFMERLHPLSSNSDMKKYSSIVNGLKTKQ
ncbi:MAG: response regulator [Nitrospira sp.]|nr:response regulator [Candidatus Brocadiales bacterium]MBL7050086.1 response regulator [Nitrospira sp.]